MLEKKLILSKQGVDEVEVIENITNDLSMQEIYNAVNGVRPSEFENAPSHFMVKYEQDGYECERLVRGLEVEDATLMTKKVED